MNEIQIARVAEKIRPTDGCRNGRRPQLRERGSRSTRVRAAVRESIGH